MWQQRGNVPEAGQYPRLGATEKVIRVSVDGIKSSNSWARGVDYSILPTPTEEHDSYRALENQSNIGTNTRSPFRGYLVIVDALYQGRTRQYVV